MTNDFPYVVEDLAREDWPARWTRQPARPRKPKIITTVCANCDSTFSLGNRPTPFCGPRCRAEADAVRYGRRSYAAHGDQLPDDIAYALKMKRLFAMSGGYPATARRLTPERRAEVIARDGGLCVLCGQPGEDIDHMNRNSPALQDLRYLCKPCHRTVSEANLVPITKPEQLLRAFHLLVRTRAPEPMRACDQPDWAANWRAWMREHATHEATAPEVEQGSGAVIPAARSQ